MKEGRERQEREVTEERTHELKKKSLRKVFFLFYFLSHQKEREEEGERKGFGTIISRLIVLSFILICSAHKGLL